MSMNKYEIVATIEAESLLEIGRELKEIGAKNWNITKQQHGLAMKRYMELSGGK